MKIFISTLLILSAAFSWSQEIGQNLPKEEIHAFWNDNIKAITDLDKDKIISQTNFPLGGSWYELYEPNNLSESTLKALYIKNIENIFDQLAIDGLNMLTWEDATTVKVDDETGISVIYARIEEEGYNLLYFEYELVFRKIKENWKLSAIKFIG